MTLDRKFWNLKFMQVRSQLRQCHHQSLFTQNVYCNVSSVVALWECRSGCVTAYYLWLVDTIVWLLPWRVTTMVMVPAGWSITREPVFYHSDTYVGGQGVTLYDQSESFFLPDINHKPLVQFRWVPQLWTSFIQTATTNSQMSLHFLVVHQWAMS